MSHRSSTNDGRHPYMVFSKVNPFWRGRQIYSQETKDYFEACLREYSKYNWPEKEEPEKELTPYLKKKLGLI